jgi:hypothetical protein
MPGGNSSNMGAKEDALRQILTRHHVIEKLNNESNNLAEQVLYSKWSKEIFLVYKSLGGRDEAYAFRGTFDITSPQYIIELDEQLHFNEYRSKTLMSPLYKQLKFFPVSEYHRYCIEYQKECLKAGSYGKKWTSDSCEKMFGQAAPNRDLSGNGSPRWKQRVFYDFVKDVSYLVTGIPVVRVSIYDMIDCKGRTIKLGDVLDNGLLQNASAVEGIKTLIEKRLGSI